jgi:hypothetical protein
LVPATAPFFVAILAAAWWLVPNVAWSRTIEISPYPITSRVAGGGALPARRSRLSGARKGRVGQLRPFRLHGRSQAVQGIAGAHCATDRDGREATRIAISIPDMPHRYEQMLLDKFVAKLRDDQGPPAPPPRKPALPPPPAPDAGPPSTTPT